MLHSVIGVSDDIELATALEEVIGECREKLESHTPRVGMLFSSCMDVNFADILSRIEREFPGIQLIGCTTDGEITPQTGFIEDALALLLLCSDTIEFATAIATNLSKDPIVAFTEAFQTALPKLSSDPICALVLPDGLSTIDLSLDKAIQKSFGSHFPVFGGSAGDHFLLTGTKQFFGTNFYTDSAPILLLGGKLTIDVSVEIGPAPTGLLYPVGRTEKNVVYEIGNQSALSFYEEHLGEFNEHFTQFPLALFDSANNLLCLRSPVTANRQDGSVKFVGDFPSKCNVRLTMASRNDYLAASEKANAELLSRSVQPPDFLFVFPCTSFRHVLGSRTNELFNSLKATGDSLPFFGFFCYGEIAPQQIGDRTRFHSDTYIVVAIYSGK